MLTPVRGQQPAQGAKIVEDSTAGAELIAQLLQLVVHEPERIESPRCTFFNRHADVFQDFRFDALGVLPEELHKVVSAFQTVERLRETYGDGPSFFFIMGADSFAELDTWREPEANSPLKPALRPGAVRLVVPL